MVKFPFLSKNIPPESTLEDIKEILRHFFNNEEVYSYAAIAFYNSYKEADKTHEETQASIKQLADNIRNIVNYNELLKNRREEKENDTDGKY